MHSSACIRSDGDWFCAPGCTHEKDQEHERIVNENVTLRRVLTEIAQGHPSPALHATSTLSSLNSEAEEGADHAEEARIRGHGRPKTPPAT